MGHLNALLNSEISLVPLQSDLVEKVRITLTRSSLAERVYGQIKRTQKARELQPWRVIDKIGADASRYFKFKSGASLSQGIPGLFTVSGYQDVFLQNGPVLSEHAAKETWVLKETNRDEMTEEQVEALLQDVTKLYFAEYIRVWNGYLRDLDIASFDSFADGAQKLKDLSADMSPIQSLLAHVGRETLLASSSADLISTNPEQGSVSEIRSQVEALLDRASEAAQLNNNTDPAAVVDRSFARLHEILKQRDQVQAPIKATLSNLNELFVALSTVEATINSGGMGDSSASANSQMQGVMRRIQLEANRQPEPLKQWLYSLVRESNMVFLRDSKQRFNQVWQSSVATFCRDAIGNRYPVMASSPNDMNISDFSRYFGPNGLLDEFFNTYLASFIDTTVKPWRLIDNAGARLEFSPESLAYFERANDIRRTFFSGASNQPNLSFQIMPLQLDAAAGQGLLELGDQRVIYQHGPVRLSRMQWPPTGMTERARFSVRVLSDGSQRTLSSDGPWAWFRLLDQGRAHATSTQDKFRVTFAVDGLDATYEIRADSVINPFTGRHLRMMTCPETL